MFPNNSPPPGCTSYSALWSDLRNPHLPISYLATKFCQFPLPKLVLNLASVPFYSLYSVAQDSVISHLNSHRPPSSTFAVSNLSLVLGPLRHEALTAIFVSTCFPRLVL